MRIGRAGSKSAASSFRTRAISVGAGSRLVSSPEARICRGRGGGGGGWGRDWDTLRLLGRLLGGVLQNDAIEEPRVARVECRHQHVVPLLGDLRVLELEGVGAAGAVPARLLLGQRTQRSDPRVD